MPDPNRPSFAGHRRQHDSALAAAERRLLVGIAERIPHAVNSDHLSALALVGMALAGSSLVLVSDPRLQTFGAAGGLAINWLGDSLDGTLARVRRAERPRFGFYVDHVIDLAGAAMLLGGLAFSGLMHPLVGMALLASFYLVMAETFLAAHASAVFRLSFLGMGPTELRIGLIAALLPSARSPFVTLGPRQVLLFDVVGTLGAAGLAVVFVASSVRNVRQLSGIEPRPVAARQGTPRALSPVRGRVD